MFLDDMVIKIGPAWQAIPSTPLRLLDGRFRSDDRVQQWSTEKESRAALEDLLTPYGFILVPEVRIRESGKPPLRIDYVAICPAGWPIRFFGIEVKRGFPKLMHVLDVVEQATRYRYAVIVDQRLSFAIGDRLNYVFVWPSLNAADDCDHRSGARAIRIMAGRLNIGSIDTAHHWRESGVSLSFRLGQEYVWTDRYDPEGRFGVGMKFSEQPLRGLRAPK